ncbi:putative ABC transport system permease protein [Micromonospora pisi]|uniref:Putative ABC transport system permease protein n=1 Tax=Micromonospora pisi TaxID=589240 RepID=A0A495JEV6_9ACTN|nr:ABC transporter permease [Micromonospora pisi]RKR87540.1 putative ABC transport system permease protein [Micromonospora pisi]
MRALLRTQLGGVARRPSRLLLTGLAILVASFVVFAAVLAQQIVARTVEATGASTPAAADLVVGDAEGNATTVSVLRQVRELPGVAEAVGRLDAGLQIGGSGGSWLRLSGDPGTGPLALARVTQGSYPDAANEIAVTARTAERLGLAVGAVTTARIEPEAPPIRMTVTGLVEADQDFGQDAYAPDGFVSALGAQEHVRQIDLRLAPGASLTAVRKQVDRIVAAAGGDRPPVRTGAEVRTAEAKGVVDRLKMVFVLVGMFIGVAVAAAALVATSTFRIVFAQRMRQLALLRAIGAGQGGLARALAFEGALTGLVTGTVGVAVALAFGHALALALRAFGLTVASPGFPLLPAVAVVAGATLITLLAVLAPAFSAARVAPLEALRAASTTSGRRDVGLVRLVLGLLLTAGAGMTVLLVFTQLPEPEALEYDAVPALALVVVSGTLAFFALVALGPVLVRPVLWLVGWPLRQLGPVGRLAVGGIGGAPRRAAAVSVVVALGVTLIAGVLVGGASMRALADREMALSAPADFELSTSDGSLLPSAVVDGVRGRGELTHVAPYRRLDGVGVSLPGSSGTGSAGGGETRFGATDLDLAALPELDKLDVRSGRLADLGPGRVVLPAYVARYSGLRAGDRVVLTREQRKIEVGVAAILPGNTPLGSGVVVDSADLDRLGATAGYVGLLADATKAGEDGRNAAQKALRQAVTGADGVGVTVLADQRDEINGLVDAMLGVALGLIGLTVLIAVVGVGTTTALSVVERVRESGLLRAVGLSRASLRIMLTAEAGLYGLIGATLGLLLGVPYAWLTVEALGANAPLELPVLPLIGVFLALIALTAVAGVLPARRASRVSPVTALATDA